LATAYVLGPGSYDDVMPIDNAATAAIFKGLSKSSKEGQNKVLMVTGGTLGVQPDPEGGETDETTALIPNPINTRYKAVQYAMDLAADSSVRVVSVRLAPYVYGRGGSGISRFMGMSAQSGSVLCVDGGKNRTTVVHVDDAARLFLLIAGQKAGINEEINASSSTTVTAGQLAEAMATALGLPVRHASFADTEAQLGKILAIFLSTENRASGGKARRELGWNPTGPGILEDISQGSYQAVAAALRKPQA
jgi:nucleoside-diphosphate-sugar epimerase